MMIFHDPPCSSKNSNQKLLNYAVCSGFKNGGLDLVDCVLDELLDLVVSLLPEELHLLCRGVPFRLHDLLLDVGDELRNELGREAANSQPELPCEELYDLVLERLLAGVEICPLDLQRILP